MYLHFYFMDIPLMDGKPSIKHSVVKANEKPFSYQLTTHPIGYVTRSIKKKMIGVFEDDVVAFLERDDERAKEIFREAYGKKLERAKERLQLAEDIMVAIEEYKG